MNKTNSGDYALFTQENIDNFFNKVRIARANAVEDLVKGTVVPFIGIIPGAAIVGVGLVSLVAGTALSILFFVPACVSKSSQIILTRSVEFIKSGCEYTVFGTFLAIPFLGTAVYYFCKPKSD